MEGLKSRAILCVVALFVAGGASLVFRPAQGETKTEEWMIENSPQELTGYVTQAGAEDARVSYVMSKSTYDVLEPFGIVARVYRDKETGESFDVVLIAGRSRESFHDPRVCFSAQGWSLSNQWLDFVDTKTHGRVPVTIALMESPEQKDQLAAYVYKGPGGFFANAQGLKMAMLWERLLGRPASDGVFYRFIPDHRVTDQAGQTTELKRFVGEYLDAASQSSRGYF